MRSLTCLSCILLLACTDRPLDDTSATGDSTGGASTAPSTAASSDPTTATSVDPTGGATDVPTPTTGPDTTAATASTGPDATATTTTATTTTTTTGLDTTDASTTTDDGTTLDPSGTTGFQPVPKPAGLVGCTLAAPPGTAIQGQTRLGPFTGNRAYFGVIGFGDDIINPNIMTLAPGADPATELQDMQGATGPFILTSPTTGTFDKWVGEWQSWFQVVKKNMSGSGSITVVITAFAGNWDAADPADPPRIVGSFAGDLTGSFDAVYCDKLDIVIIPE